MQKWKIVFGFVSVIVVSTIALRTRKHCRVKEVLYGYVCVNDEHYCDNLHVPEPSGNEYLLVTSAKQKDRFVYEIGKFKHSKGSKKCKSVIKIDPSITYQTISGFGGGYTGAVTHLVNRLSPNMRKCLFKSYFSQSIGAGYTYLRVPIGGTDFGLYPWAYNEYPENDAKLSNFTQLHIEDLMRNAQIKELMHVSKNPHVNILGAAWGPPKWMKQKNDWNGGVDNQLKCEHYPTWANYHLRWIRLMHNDGINIWAISTGNEPASANQIEFQILSWNASDQAFWIENYLGPKMAKSKYSHVEIHGFDDNRDLAPKWIHQMETGAKKCFNYIKGLAFHAYSDKALGPGYLDSIQSRYPHIKIWYSEMCFGAFFMTQYIGPVLGTWERAQKLVSIMIENFSHSTVGYIDWNLILDANGGPSYVGNAIDSYIILSEDYKEMYKQPTFYVMAHFSKFITPGSVRINADILLCGRSKLKTIAFLRPDDKIVVIVYNGAKRSVGVTVKDKSKGSINIRLKPKSINTLVYEAGSLSKCKSGKHC